MTSGALGRRAGAAALVGLALLAPRKAWADDASTLEAEIDHDVSTLGTGDCAVACRALASIRRAAAKLCALEPGPRCDAARAKADEATKRVRDACPDCAIAAGPANAPEAPMPAKAEAAPAPPAEAPHGGCASCAAAGDGSVPDVLPWVAVALAVGLRSRRRRST